MIQPMGVENWTNRVSTVSNQTKGQSLVMDAEWCIHLEIKIKHMLISMFIWFCSVFPIKSMVIIDSDGSFARLDVCQFDTFFPYVLIYTCMCIHICICMGIYMYTIYLYISTNISHFLCGVYSGPAQKKLMISNHSFVTGMNHLN